MAYSFKGNLTVCGASGSATAIAAAMTWQAFSVDHAFPVGEIKDANGVVVGIYTNGDETFEGELTVKPISTVAATARDAIAYLSPLTKVTITSVTSNATRGLNDDYACMGARVSYGNESTVEYVLRLKKWGSVNLSASLS